MALVVDQKLNAGNDNEDGGGVGVDVGIAGAGVPGPYMPGNEEPIALVAMSDNKNMKADEVEPMKQKKDNKNNKENVFDNVAPALEIPGNNPSFENAGSNLMNPATPNAEETSITLSIPGPVVPGASASAGQRGQGGGGPARMSLARNDSIKMPLLKEEESLHENIPITPKIEDNDENENKLKNDENVQANRLGWHV